MEDYCVELAAKLGFSFTQDPQICRSYNHDLGEMPAVLLGLFKRTPGAVALPRTAQQVSDCLSVAHKHRVPVTVRAQASSGYGGTMPTVGGLLVDVSRMNKVISVDEEHRTCDVEPGVVWKDLNEELSRHGLASRICPTSGPSSTVGGMFAMGGVGIGSYRYGSILDCVEEIDVVDPDGTMRTVKGHELSVYAFSQGTLGIITRLRLLLRKDVELSKLAFQLASADQVDQVIQLLSLLHPYSISVLSAPYLIMQAENAKKPGQPPITSGFLMLAVFEEKPDEATVQKITGAAHIKLLEQAVADEEWEERFYPMRLKRGGPSLLCGEYVVPRSLFGPCWKKITGRMPRDIVGLEAFADNQNQMSTLVYVLDSSEDFLSLFRMGKAMIPLHVARRFGGYVYASGLWFNSQSRSILGLGRWQYLKERKKALDPQNLLNTGKCCGIGLRHLPFSLLSWGIWLGTVLIAPVSAFLKARPRKLTGHEED